MPSPIRFILRRRRMAVLGVTLLSSFLLLSLQARQESPSVEFLKKGLLLSLSPFLKLSTFAVKRVSAVWTEYVDLRGLRQESLRLKEEVHQLQIQLYALQEAALENERLLNLMELKRRMPYRTLAARVIGKDATNWFRSVIIDKGSGAGIRRNMPVLAPEGLVGRVVEVAAFSSKVQLITDPMSSVGVTVQRSRATAVAVGHLGMSLRLKYLPLMADVVIGDRVITSGIGGIFPKGIPIGEVAWTRRPSGALFQEAGIIPGVDLSRLEEVLIIVSGGESQVLRDETRNP